MEKITRKDWDDNASTDVDKWLAIYKQDDNIFWDSASGHHQNVIDELITRAEESAAEASEQIVKIFSEDPGGEVTQLIFKWFVEVAGPQISSQGSIYENAAENLSDRLAEFLKRKL